MRKTSEENGVSVKAYAGTTGVMLAMNMDDARREGLLGFAIERLKVQENKKDWLAGGLHFPGAAHSDGGIFPSNEAPIQLFRWSDYTVYPDKDYEYTIHPVYGTPANLKVESGPIVQIRTESIETGEHRVLFNRAAAASQAFARRFEGFLARSAAARKAKIDPPPLPPNAQAWLTRGLLDQILNFIRSANDDTWALDIAIYEYELPAIIQEVEAAFARKVNLRVVYHAKPKDPQTDLNQHNLSGLPPEALRARLTSKICHHKFIVLSHMEKGKRVPKEVLCGSTNFTENGVYRQANVVHILERADIAGQYLDLFEVLFRGDDVSETRDFINANRPMLPPQPLFAGFSPRSELTDLKQFIDIVNGAKRDVLFCTAFKLYDPLQNALLGKAHDPILRYGLQNTRSKITGFHADRTARFTATAMLSQGLEGWLKESTAGQKGNILVHTKLLLVDFTSDSPIVVSGSHNYSKPASNDNDENFLILRGNTGVSDTYGCELMRLYDHYRFRFFKQEGLKAEAKARKSGKKLKPHELSLDIDSRWTDEYFGGDALKTLDRKRFAGEPV